ncbi:MAG: MinD/ParA family protein [Spirochaetota bacterium]|nr:MinD/ParA family protein [Spirochaetota bacterium]
MAIASGKGGVGKTNFAINLGILLAKAGKRVLIMDMDLGLANVNVILGMIPKFNLYHVIKGQKKMSEIISESPYGVRIIAGASGFSKLADLAEEERTRFMDEISGISDYDYVIIDTGAGVSRNVLSFVLAADEAIIITTPEPTAITDAYGIIKAISTEVGQSIIKLVVNCVSSVSDGRQVAERVIGIAGQFLNIRVENLGFIYYDQAVLASVMKQKPYVLAEPTSRAAECIDHIARKLLGMPPVSNSGGFSGFIRNLLSANKED